MGEVVQAGGYDAERQELANVLASSAFARSQRLVKLLEYISEKHFLAQAEEVCEYSIAREVLGRPSDFDPAEDAIARVEIHRLRKKLREHYAGEGAHQTLKIIIPPGMYTPLFQREGNSTADGQTNGRVHEDPPIIEPVIPQEPPAGPFAASELDPPARKGHVWLWLAGLTTVIAVFGVLAIWPSVPRVESLPPPRSAAPVWSGGSDSAIRIVSGYDRQYIDHNGHTWSPDHFFEGGGRPSAPFRQFIARTADPLLYQNGRIGVTSYSIPLKSGNYELKLHFVEPVYGPGLETGGGENSRVFDILLNGKLAVDGFDIVADAGAPLTADTRVFKDVQPAADGLLKIAFHAKREQPIVSGLEIEPAELHRMNSIRIVTQPNSVTDSHGQVWEADNYYYGGQISNHWKAVSGTPEPDLFANERYGHFTYAIPVAPGSYTATMYFAETYWGTENQGGGGPGQRIFNIFCNGSALFRNLDILRETAPNHALVKRFRGLRPNAQGKLNFEFVPVVNYASVFAIEVVDEGP
jgi:hypothetical protein